MNFKGGLRLFDGHVFVGDIQRRHNVEGFGLFKKPGDEARPFFLGFMRFEFHNVVNLHIDNGLVRNRNLEGHSLTNVTVQDISTKNKTLVFRGFL